MKYLTGWKEMPATPCCMGLNLQSFKAGSSNSAPDWRGKQPLLTGVSLKVDSQEGERRGFHPEKHQKTDDGSGKNRGG